MFIGLIGVQTLSFK